MWKLTPIILMALTAACVKTPVESSGQNTTSADAAADAAVESPSSATVQVVPCMALDERANVVRVKDMRYQKENVVDGINKGDFFASYVTLKMADATIRVCSSEKRMEDVLQEGDMGNFSNFTRLS
jgi:hypothetical protein